MPNPYGAPDCLSPLECEMGAYMKDLGPEVGGLGRFAHFQRVINMLDPKTEWNPWLERFTRTFVDNDWICDAGCASSGKTHGSALCAGAWWLCDPAETSVILTSTTKAMLRKRAWGVLQGFYRGLSIGAFGNWVDSKTAWQCRKGDDKHAIFGVAVEDGNVNKAIDHIKGIHTRRQLVVVDEATSVPQAVFEACANLYAGAEEFKMVVMGNPRSRLDVMGRFMEPAAGWDSVNVETEEWETVKQLNGKHGICVRFDAEKSPNVLAGEDKWPYLVTEPRLNNARRRLGKDSPQFYTEYRGFPPLEGTLKTVLTEGLIEQSKAMGNEHEFTGDWWLNVAALDPAFGGGDRPCLRFARVGMLPGETVGMNLRKTVMLEIDASKSFNEPTHFQLARQLEDYCKEEGVKPANVIIDAGGEGGGLCDIVQRNWGQIIRCEFGGAAGADPISTEDDRPANEVYANKAAEMWFCVKEFAVSGQLKGLDQEAAAEFCQREYIDRAKDGRSIRIKLEPKEEYKKKYGRSPDLADAVAMVVEAGRRAGMVLKGIGEGAEQRKEEWGKYQALADGAFGDPSEGLY